MATCDAPAPESLLKEQLLTFNQGRKLPLRPCRKTILTWVNVGCKSKRTGKLVFLECVQIGRIWYTSVEAHQRFVARLNEK